MKYVTAQFNREIIIGHAGENEAISVVFNLAYFEKHWPDGKPLLLVRRPNDTEAYPVSVEVNDHKCVWLVSSADSAQAGIGECELQWSVGDTVAKSDIYKLKIVESLDVGTEPPEDPEKRWFDKIESEKLDKNQGADNAGKALVIGDDGNVVPGEVQGGGSLPSMSSDTAGKMLTNDGDKAEWGFGTPLTVNIASTDNGVTIDQTFQNLLAAIRSNRKIITVINEIETAAVYKVLEDGKRIDIELGFSPPGIEDRGVDGARAWLDYYSLYDDEGFSFGSESLIDGFLHGYTFNAPSTENISGVTIVAKPFPADRQSGTKPRLYCYEASDPLRRCYITDDGSGGYIYKDCLGNEYDPTPFSGGYQIFAMYYNFLSVVYNRRMYYKQDETSEDVSFLSGNGDVIRFGEGGIRFFPNSAGSVPKATAADKGKTLTVDEYGYYQLVDPAKQIMVVNFTADDGNWSADKSWDDVAAFFENGGYVYALTGINYLPLVAYIPNAMMHFSSVSGNMTINVLWERAKEPEVVDYILPAVNYTEQTLTADQQAQARKNIGLDQVDNTSDANKPVSTAQEAAIKVVQDALDQYKTDVANGTVIPARATGDASGNNIANTYATKQELANISAVQIRNKDEVINATQETVQTVATAYMVNNYGRQPQNLDGLILTITDLNNDKILYIYSAVSSLWINAGINGVDLSKYVGVAQQTFTDAEKAQARQNIGAGTSSFSGSYNDLEDKPTIPTIPTALPNPNALTIKVGDTTTAYDGSAARAVTIPSGGSSGGDTWELINTFEVAEADAARVIKIDKDSNGNAFSLKEFAFRAVTNSAKTDGNVYGWFCVNGKGTYNSGLGGFITNYVRHPSIDAAIANDVIGRALPCGLVYDHTTERKASEGVVVTSVTDVHEVELAGYQYAENLLYGTFSLWGVRK